MKSLFRNMLEEMPELFQPVDPKLVACINAIWSEFQDDKSIKRIPAEEFGHLEAKYNPHTIIEAKKALYIKSEQDNGHWFWLRPRFTARVAIEKASYTPANKVRKAGNRKLQRGSVNTLRRIMIEHRYVILNTTARELMMDVELFSHATVQLAKNILGVASYKRDGVTRWVWPAPKVQQWLLDQLADGPKTASALFYAAKLEKEWDEIVVIYAKKALNPRIHMFTSGTSRITKWIDSAQLAREKTGEVVSVDFEPEPELDVLAPGAIKMIDDSEEEIYEDE